MSTPLPTWLSLYVRPKEFFSKHEFILSEKVYYYGAVLYCIATSIDQIEKKIFMKQNAGGIVNLDWFGYWKNVLIGAIFAILGLAIASWWYDKRMGYAGITRNFNMAKRVYLYSSLIWAFPAIIVQVLYTLFYPTPLASGEIGFIDVLDLSLIIFSFYSIWVSYTGLKFLYPEAKISKLRLWFLTLPTLVYILGLVFLIGAILRQS